MTGSRRFAFHIFLRKISKTVLTKSKIWLYNTITTSKIVFAYEMSNKRRAVYSHSAEADPFLAGTERAVRFPAENVPYPEQNNMTKEENSMKRYLAVLLTAILMVGCVSFPAAADGTTPITIDFWNTWTGSDGAVMDEIVERFNATNPYGITVNMDRDAEMETKIQVAYAANSAPPLILMSSMNIVPQLLQGNIVPMDDIFDSTALEESDFVEAIINDCRFQDHLYVLPMQVNSRFLYWNKDLLNAAGFDGENGPQTWEELAEMSLAITDESKNIYGGGAPYDYAGGLIIMMMDFGGQLLSGTSAEDYASALYSEENLEALNFWRDMIDNHSAPALGNADYSTMFKAGTLGFTIAGPYFSVGLSDYVNYGVSVLPAGPVAQVADTSISGFAITKNSTPEQTAASYKFIEYWNNALTSTEEFDLIPAVRWSKDIGFPPYLKSVRDNEEIASMEPLATFSTFADYAASIYPKDFNALTFLLFDVINPMFETIAYGGEVDSTLKHYSDVLDTWREH